MLERKGPHTVKKLWIERRRISARDVMRVETLRLDLVIKVVAD